MGHVFAMSISKG
jgi:hypothetical protein